MAKRIVRLTESELHKIITESVSRILQEEEMLNEFKFGKLGKGLAMGALGAASLFGGYGNAHAQDNTVYVDGKVPIEKSSDAATQKASRYIDFGTRNLGSERNDGSVRPTGEGIKYLNNVIQVTNPEMFLGQQQKVKLKRWLDSNFDGLYQKFRNNVHITPKSDAEKALMINAFLKAEDKYGEDGFFTIQYHNDKTNHDYLIILSKDNVQSMVR